MRVERVEGRRLTARQRRRPFASAPGARAPTLPGGQPPSFSPLYPHKLRPDAVFSRGKCEEFLFEQFLNWSATLWGASLPCIYGVGVPTKMTGRRWFWSVAGVCWHKSQRETGILSARSGERGVRWRTRNYGKTCGENEKTRFWNQILTVCPLLDPGTPLL